MSGILGNEVWEKTETQTEVLRAANSVFLTVLSLKSRADVSTVEECVHLFETILLQLKHLLLAHLPRKKNNTELNL